MEDVRCGDIIVKATSGLKISPSRERVSSVLVPKQPERLNKDGRGELTSSEKPSTGFGASIYRSSNHVEEDMNIGWHGN